MKKLLALALVFTTVINPAIAGLSSIPVNPSSIKFTGGKIDGVVIGSSVPATGNFTTISGNGAAITGVNAASATYAATAGTASSVATNANLTGVVTSVGNITSIAASAITNTMLSNGAVANLSGTNTGDNSANSTYAADYRAGNFIAGTNYLVPNGSAAALTGFPILNQNTTGTASNVTGIVSIANGGTGTGTGIAPSLTVGNATTAAYATRASIPYADATGTSDALTASFPTLPTTIIDGQDFTIGIVTPNATSAPTFTVTVGGVIQPTWQIVKFVGNSEVNLSIGDLTGDAWVKADAPNSKWVLQTPITTNGAIGTVTPSTGVFTTMTTSSAVVSSGSLYSPVDVVIGVSGVVSSVQSFGGGARWRFGGGADLGATVQVQGTILSTGTTQAANFLMSATLYNATAAPTIASASTIAPTKDITFVSGTTAISTITPPAGIGTSGGCIKLIPTGLFTTTTAGNIALASVAVVNKILMMCYDATTTKWYPAY